MANEETSKPDYEQPTSGSGGMNDLHYAAYDGNLEAVQASLAQGIPINGRDKSNWTALHWVVDMGCTSGPRDRIIQLLLQSGADLEARDFEGRTPLHIACSSTSGHLASLLIDAGADIEARDRDGRTPLMEAAHHGDLEAVSYLLDRGADPSSRANDQRTALDMATLDGDRVPAEPGSHLPAKLRESLAAWDMTRQKLVALLKQAMG